MMMDGAENSKGAQNYSCTCSAAEADSTRHTFVCVTFVRLWGMECCQPKNTTGTHQHRPSRDRQREYRRQEERIPSSCELNFSSVSHSFQYPNEYMMKFVYLSSAVACLLQTSSVLAFVPSYSTRVSSSTRCSQAHMSNGDEMAEDRRTFITQTAASVSLATIMGGMSQPAEAAVYSMWAKAQIPFVETVYDIDFDSETHGYIVGSRGAFAETNDGGKTWEPRSFSNLDAEEEITYRFQVVSFKDGEGWVLGKPTLLLHTKDGGKSWERIPLSPKLPGEPATIIALGPSKAEMITTTGAIYTTENAGRNWKAQVKETIDATLNRVSSSGVSGASYFAGQIVNQVRDDDGAYLAVSSRGNFFLTWEPGQDFWVPHNRGTPRRIQNMGFAEGDINKGLWMTLNGGKLLISPKQADLTKDTFDFTEADIKTGGYGITDVAWRNENEVWAVGGSNTMYVSFDGGKKFSFDKSANDFPGNLYRVKFFKEYGNMGWALGSNGVLMRYQG